MHSDVGGFWGFGMTRVNLMTPQFKLQGDRVVLPNHFQLLSSTASQFS